MPIPCETTYLLKQHEVRELKPVPSVDHESERKADRFYESADRIWEAAGPDGVIYPSSIKRDDQHDYDTELFLEIGRLARDKTPESNRRIGEIISAQIRRACAEYVDSI